MTVSAHGAIVGALERLYAAPRLERIKRPISHRQGLTARLAAIEAGRGGEQAAAQAAGVTLRTWRGWKRHPKAVLARSSREGVEQAYDADWNRRNTDPVRQLRFALARAREEHDVTIWAEMQWDGYYNGQSKSVGAKRKAPFPHNDQAFRRVRFGGHDITPVVRAWKSGHDTRAAMEQLLSQNMGAQIFLNSYHQNASVAEL